MIHVRTRPHRGLPACLLLAALALGCREGSESSSAAFIGIPASEAGNQGCNGTVGTTQVDSLGVFAWIGPSSQLAAAGGEEVLYATGSGATVHVLDLTGPALVESQLVDPFVIDSTINNLGVRPPADLSGIQVFDDNSLLAIERASNTIFLISRMAPNSAISIIGNPNGDGGFADGLNGDIRFDFSQPSQFVTTGENDDAFDDVLFVADPGNHAIRIVFLGLFAESATVAGNGAPGFEDGGLVDARFDTPTGVSVTCDGRLVVTELGAERAGGHRLRALSVGARDFFDDFQGDAETLAGDGTAATTAGLGEAASLDAPVSPVVTSDGEVYWMDSGTGSLRRLTLSSGEVDCPLAADCASAGGTFTAGGAFSLAIGASGVLYVLDSDAQEIFRVRP